MGRSTSRCPRAPTATTTSPVRPSTCQSESACAPGARRPVTHHHAVSIAMRSVILTASFGGHRHGRRWPVGGSVLHPYVVMLAQPGLATQVVERVLSASDVNVVDLMTAAA